MEELRLILLVSPIDTDMDLTQRAVLEQQRYDSLILLPQLQLVDVSLDKVVGILGVLVLRILELRGIHIWILTDEELQSGPLSLQKLAKLIHYKGHTGQIPVTCRYL